MAEHETLQQQVERIIKVTRHEQYLTDREMIACVFIAIAGLAERLTGEQMEVGIFTKRGLRKLVGGRTIRWFKDPETASDSLPASGI